MEIDPPSNRQDKAVAVSGRDAPPVSVVGAKAKETQIVYFPPAPGYKKNLTKKDYERLTEDFQEDFKTIWKRTPDPWRPTPDFIKTSINSSNDKSANIVDGYTEVAHFDFKFSKNIDLDKAVKYLDYCGIPRWFIEEYYDTIDDALTKNKKRRGGQLTANRVNSFIGKLCERFFEKYKGDTLRTLLRKNFIEEPSQEAAIYVFSKLIDTVAGKGISRETIKTHVFIWRAPEV